MLKAAELFPQIEFFWPCLEVVVLVLQDTDSGENDERLGRAPVWGPFTVRWAMRASGLGGSDSFLAVISRTTGTPRKLYLTCVKLVMARASWRNEPMQL